MGYIGRVTKWGVMIDDEPAGIGEEIPLRAQPAETDEDLVLTGLTGEVPA
jgi:hypothetical protein